MERITVSRVTLTTVLFAAALAPSGARAEKQETRPRSEQVEARARSAEQSDLAKQVQNPVSDLVSVPFQNNLDYGMGPFDRTRNTLNIQPVIPFALDLRWNLITRTIIPIIYQPDLQRETGGTTGLGDINPTAWLSPARSGDIIWGLGATALLPTATQRPVGTGKWGIGPSAVALVQPAPWTVGALAHHIWSFAGPDDRTQVSQSLLQYFINYNLPDGWYVTSSPIITANWEAPEGTDWVVPFGGGIGKIFHLGDAPLNGQIHAYNTTVGGDQNEGPSWQLRFQLALLFPK
jgi:hypothetical protein